MYVYSTDAYMLCIQYRYMLCIQYRYIRTCCVYSTGTYVHAVYTVWICVIAKVRTSREAVADIQTPLPNCY